MKAKLIDLFLVLFQPIYAGWSGWDMIGPATAFWVYYELNPRDFLSIFTFSVFWFLTGGHLRHMLGKAREKNQGVGK